MVTRSNGDQLPSFFLQPSALPGSHAYTTQVTHQDALEAARNEHLRVRESALQAYERDVLRKQQSFHRQAVEQQNERIRLERENAALVARAIELHKVRIPTPTPPPPPSVAAPRRPVEATELLANEKTLPTHSTNIAKPAEIQGRASIVSAPEERPAVPNTQPRDQALQSFNQPQSHAQLQRGTAERVDNQPLTNNLNAPLNPAWEVQQSTHETGLQPGGSIHSHVHPASSRYPDIHQNLKKLRKFMADNAKKIPALKSKMGDMRREIRKSVGQMTEGKGKNKQPMAKIVSILREALVLPSPPSDPTLFTVSPPTPIEGHPDQLPTLFIYLLNIFSKAVVAQFIDEAGVSPKAADPIGVVAVSIYANNEFKWRGRSLIDILIAKLYKVCPVLFGARGNEKTEEGRARLGWRKDGGNFVHEQVHNTRMTGLGAGYAALALRDFGKSSMVNPYPPSNYWRSMACIVDTPDPSATQYLVLKAMIENYEERFLRFYGSAGKAALRVALVDFPARVSGSNVAAASLKVLGDKLQKDVGLRLA